MLRKRNKFIYVVTVAKTQQQTFTYKKLLKTSTEVKEKLSKLSSNPFLMFWLLHEFYLLSFNILIYGFRESYKKIQKQLPRSINFDKRINQ